MANPFLSDRGVTRSVLGRDLVFYPVTVWTAFKLKPLAKSIGKSLQTFFSGGATLQTSKQQDVTEGTEGGAFQRVRELQAIDPKLAEMRHVYMQAAIDDLIDTAMQPDTAHLVVDVICDCLRNEGITPPKSTEEKRRFLENLSSDAFTEILMGIYEANKAIFSPLVQAVRARFGALQESQKAPAAPTTGSS
jgi:hypothetical protein